jgi:hypothetical protein
LPVRPVIPHINVNVGHLIVSQIEVNWVWHV